MKIKFSVATLFKGLLENLISIQATALAGIYN